jgi:putative Mn2+ efflux pump MntP
MNVFDISIIAIGLSMDSLAVALTCGTVLKRFEWKPVLRILIVFTLFQASMPVAGWWLGKQFVEVIQHWDHWIAFGILSLLGLHMIWEYIRSARQPHKTSRLNPRRKRVVYSLALATSLDALAVGIPFSFLSFNLCLAVCLIGASTLLFTSLGLWLGMRYCCRFRIPAELFGGLILILIGIKILIEHLSV